MSSSRDELLKLNASGTSAGRAYFSFPASRIYIGVLAPLQGILRVPAARLSSNTRIYAGEWTADRSIAVGLLVG
jgi:hypothetical protein